MEEVLEKCLDILLIKVFLNDQFYDHTREYIVSGGSMISSLL